MSKPAMPKLLQIWCVECEAAGGMVREGRKFLLMPEESLVTIGQAIEAQAASHDRLSAEVEALRKDAERYRWLRHGDNDERVLMVYDGEARPFDHRFDECWLPRNEKLDAAIDAAASLDASDSGEGGR